MISSTPMFDPTTVNGELILISEAELSMRAAYMQTMLQFEGDKNQATINEFISYVTTGIMPSMMVTKKGLMDLSNQVFLYIIPHDFVTTLTFNFLTFYGADNERIQWLARRIAQGISIDDSSSYSVVPDVYRQRMASTDDAYNFIVNNKWLLTLLCLKLFTVPTYIREAPSGNGKQ